jgi:hypothetical protein
MGTLMTTEAEDHRAGTLVWIDAREAVIVRIQGHRARIERVESEVPAHHRATGHVRHDPAIRHGGGGSPQSAGEPHRIEHLNRFVGDIANVLNGDDDVLVIGPGTVHERLAGQLSETDEHHGRHRDISCQTSPPLTDGQLVARLRRFAGIEPRRRSVGAYRWSEPSGHHPSGKADLLPRRVVGKPPRERRREVPAERG